MATLTLHLHRPWFDAIAHGHKTVEYRRVTPYWQKRIENRTYATLILQNGYGERYPTLEAEYKGYDMYTHHDGIQYYRLKLGAITAVRNYTLASTPSVSDGMCMDLNQCFHPNEHTRCMRRCSITGTWQPRQLDVHIIAEPTIQNAPAPTSLSSPTSAPLSPSIAAGGTATAAVSVVDGSGTLVGETTLHV